MTNVSRQRYWSPVTPHFFKVILDDTLLPGKLMIPKGFVSKHGKSLPDQLLLKVEGDANWPVELEKCDGSVWICKGFRDFLDFYSINPGQFIVFRYEGGSVFHVLIVDLSMTEIVYPQKPIAPENSLDPEIVEIDDDSTESEEHIISPEDRNKSDSRLRTPHHEAKSSHSGERSSKLKKNMHSCCSSRDYGGRIKESGKKATPFQKTCLRSDALKKARKFKSEHPSFLVIIQPCYLKKCMRVPGGFVKSQIKKRLVAEEVTLVFRGGSWTVKFVNYPQHRNGMFYAGWRMFSTDNSLSTGDVCVFELIENNPMVFRVSIFRHAG